MPSYADIVARRLTEQLLQGTAPWIVARPAGSHFLPYNPISERRYHGVNAIWLLSAASAYGFADSTLADIETGALAGWTDPRKGTGQHHPILVMAAGKAAPR